MDCEKTTPLVHKCPSYAEPRHENNVFALKSNFPSHFMYSVRLKFVCTGWRRGTKSDHEDDQNSDPPPLDKRESRSEMQVHRTVPATGAGRGRMSFRAASQATLTFLSARKRIEDGIKTLGKKMTRRGSCDGRAFIRDLC